MLEYYEIILNALDFYARGMEEKLCHERDIDKRALLQTIIRRTRYLYRRYKEKKEEDTI